MRLMAMLMSVIAVAVVVVGCGSSSSEPLTKAEYIKQGDAICKKGLKGVRDEYAAIVKKNKGKEGEELSKGSEGEIADVLLTYYQAKTEELSGLTPPEADEAQIEKMIAALEKAVEEGEKDSEVLFDENKPVDEERKIADEYGLKSCAEI